MKKSGTRLFPLFILGLTSISVQVVLLRKFLDVFYGNELIIGLMLASWMLLTGIGSWLGRVTLPAREKRNAILSLAFLWLGLIPLLAVPLVTAGRILLFPPGATTGFTGIFFFTLAVQLPFCLVSGWMFPALVDETGEEDRHPVPAAYIAESLGSVAGALVFNVLLLYYLPSYLSLYLIFLVNLVQSFLLERGKEGRTPLLQPVLLTFVTLFLVFYQPQERLTEWFYQGQRVILEKENPYGNIVITESAGQYNFFENGLPVFTPNDPISREEAVHYAMLQHPSPGKVLLISGGISGQIPEILKYPVERIDYLEVNPWLLSFGRHMGLVPEDPRVRTVAEDARLFLKKSRDEYDVVLIQLPDPVTAQLNRYYTHDFFRELQRNLAHEAVLGISLRGTPDYVNPEAKQINSLIYNSLMMNFRYVAIVPGQRNYFIACNKKPDIRMGLASLERGISNTYVNMDYLRDDLLINRSNWLKDQLDPEAGLNRDLHPRAYFSESRLWLLALGSMWWVPALLVAGALAVMMIRYRRGEYSLFVTGFTSSSLGFMILMAFQAYYGYVYLMTAVLLAAFMLGLALGSAGYRLSDRNGNGPSPAWMQIYFGVFVIVLLMVLLGHKSLTHSAQVLTLLFIGLNLVNGVMTGGQFAAVASEQDDKPGRTASGIYGAELTGAALGMLLTAALLLPLGGIIWLCIGLGLVNFILGFALFE